LTSETIAAVPAYGDLALRFVLDLAAIAALMFAIYRPRHGRMDLIVVYGLFNIGLFLAIVAITSGDISLGVGLGLFAVLSMIRLRSETFDNRELGYFFVALVLALVTAIELGRPLFTAVLAAAAVVAAWGIDHPRMSRRTRRLEVVLDSVFTDRGELQRQLEESVDGRVVEAWVLEIDHVRETTRAAVRYEAAP
jgi:hypothetical protein